MRVTNLEGAKLARADLSDADLRFVTLQGAELQGTELKGANLRYAILKETDLAWADLQQVTNLEGATMPDGQPYEEWLKGKEAREEDGGTTSLRNGSQKRTSWKPD
jgi:uncharacterized protein YjbI with pentapeptide repeats